MEDCAGAQLKDADKAFLVAILCGLLAATALVAAQIILLLWH